MRIKLYFSLENNKIGIQYRKNIISWIKHALQEYDNEFFETVYQLNSTKTFTWSVIFPAPIFKEEEIILADASFSMIFSSYNDYQSIQFYNAFLAQKLKKYSLNCNSMTLKGITMLTEPTIQNETILIKTVSPIITRDHNQETKKDKYYSFEREEFIPCLKMNVEEQLKGEGLDKDLIEGFKIKPLQAKKVIVKLYEKKIECSVGTFQISGKQELLNYLIKAGLGSKKGMGFGLTECI